MTSKALIFLAAILALSGGILAQSYNASATPATTLALPEFSAPDVDGKLHSSKEWQGKLLVINFWATWCPPCRKEISVFMALQSQYGKQGLQFIGIAIDDQEPVAEYLAAMKVNYPNLISGVNGMALAQQLGNSVDAVPYTVVVNPQGQIIHQHPGEFTKEQILAVIKPLLK